MDLIPDFRTPLAHVRLSDCPSIYYNPDAFARLTPDQRDFVLAHEQAHCRGITGEVEADEAAKRVLGLSKDQACKILSDTLPPNHERINAMCKHCTDQNLYYIPPVAELPDFQAVATEIEQNNPGFFDGLNFDDILGVVSDYINSRNRQNQPAPTPQPQPAQNGIDPTLLIAGGMFLLLILIIALKK